MLNFYITNSFHFSSDNTQNIIKVRGYERQRKADAIVLGTESQHAVLYRLFKCSNMDIRVGNLLLRD